MPFFAEDVDAVKESWRLLLQRGAKMFYPAHGKPFAADRLRKWREEYRQFIREVPALNFVRWLRKEKGLLEKYGEEYQEYTKKVPYRIIPRLF